MAVFIPWTLPGAPGGGTPGVGQGFRSCTELDMGAGPGGNVMTTLPSPLIAGSERKLTSMPIKSSPSSPSRSTNGGVGEAVMDVGEAKDIGDGVGENTGLGGAETGTGAEDPTIPL